MTTVFNVLDYGATGNGVTDDTAAIQTAINDAVALQTGIYPGGGVYAPPGYNFFVAGNLTIPKPIRVRFESFISSNLASGDCLVIGSAGWAQYYDMEFAGFVNIAGNTGMPASVDTSGASAVHVLNLVFSRLKIGAIQGWTNNGMYLDGTGEMFSPQVIQHNRISIGQLVNNGVGINCQSLSASTSSVEANFIHVSDSYQNFNGTVLDPTNSSGATTSNYFLFDAIDNANTADGGQGIQVNGSFNRLDITYLGTNVWFGPGASYNTLNLYNTAASGATYTAGGTGNVYNRMGG